MYYLNPYSGYGNVSCGCRGGYCSCEPNYYVRPLYYGGYHGGYGRAFGRGYMRGYGRGYYGGHGHGYGHGHGKGHYGW